MRIIETLAQTIKSTEVNLQTKKLDETTFPEILQVVFGIAGAIAVIVIMLAAFRYITSQGNPQETAQAKNTIVYAVVGLLICIGAFAIINFVINRVA